MSDAATLLRRYLEQRRDLGEAELYLDRFSAHELPALLAPRPAPPAALPVAPAARPADALGRTPVEAAAGAPAHGVTGGEIVQIGSLGALRETALGCPRCRLAETRRHVVFGEGSPTAELMIVGEAPGAEEDRTGRPFVGRAGALLELLLASVGFRREDVYICNVLKCRPPGNRDPQPEEIEACTPYLVRQVELIGPRAILACGTFAAQTLLGTNVPIGRLRGGKHHWRGVPLVAVYHPAALLRNPAWVRATWEDLQRLRAILPAR